ncbi:MAG: ATP-binding cassette subfamily F protein uup, partial [Methylophagaceae bacterium]
DWVNQRQLDQHETTGKTKATAKPIKSGGKKSSLTYQEQLDLAALPKQIETMEVKQTELNNKISQPKFYQQSEDKVAAVQDKLTQLTEKLELAYERWQQLEAKQESA